MRHGEQKEWNKSARQQPSLWGMMQVSQLLAHIRIRYYAHKYNHVNPYRYQLHMKLLSGLKTPNTTYRYTVCKHACIGVQLQHFTPETHQECSYDDARINAVGYQTCTGSVIVVHVLNNSVQALGLSYMTRPFQSKSNSRF